MDNGDPYGYTGEWYGGYTGLLHLRARWYAVETGTFLSVDPVESEPPYQYVRGNVVNRVDHSGLCAEVGDEACWSLYEQIKRLCPECKYVMTPDTNGELRPTLLEDVDEARLRGLVQGLTHKSTYMKTTSENPVYVTVCELMNPCYSLS